MTASNEVRRPPRQGARQLATRAALRTLMRRPRWFFTNLRYGPEVIRDRRREASPHAFGGRFIVHERAAAAAVLGVTEADYEAAKAALWRPPPAPDEPLSLWNARDELLSLAGATVAILRPAVVVETGVALGYTSATILRAMERNGNGRLHSIDLPALQYDVDALPGKAVPAELRHRWDLRLGDSRALLPGLVAEVAPLDVFLHDARHTYSSQLREYRTAWPYLRPGGVLISDDVGNPAFVEFAREAGVVPRLVLGSTRDSAVGLLRKP